MSGQTPEKWASDEEAIAAFGAHHGYGDAPTAAVEWMRLTPEERVNWRAAVDAMRMLTAIKGPPPAPELTAAMGEARELRKVITELLGMFRAVSGGWGARTSSSRLRKIAERAAVPWDEYKREAPDTDEAAETRKANEELTTLRQRIDAIAEGLEHRAEINRPSKVSEICDNIAASLRRVHEGMEG